MKKCVQVSLTSTRQPNAGAPQSLAVSLDRGSMKVRADAALATCVDWSLPAY